MLITITDWVDDGGSFTCEDADVAEKIKPWFSDAAYGVLRSIDHLQDAISRRDAPAVEAWANYLGLRVAATIQHGENA